VRTHGEVCEVFNKPHTQERVDLSALCEVCEVCEVLDKKIKLNRRLLRPWVRLGSWVVEEAKKKQDWALKPRTPRTPHTMHVLCGSFVCEVFVRAKNAHTGPGVRLSICPGGVRAYAVDSCLWPLHAHLNLYPAIARRGNSACVIPYFSLRAPATRFVSHLKMLSSKDGRSPASADVSRAGSAIAWSSAGSVGCPHSSISG
jgi:hypothetical protein